jgi:quinol monooxygenase YgiN
MASMLIQHPVTNYSAWKKEFESVAALRKSSGELSHQIFHDADDANNLTLLFKWDSVANAQKFANSPELHAAMEKAGVAGPPKIYFLNED